MIQSEASSGPRASREAHGLRFEEWRRALSDAHGGPIDRQHRGLISAAESRRIASNGQAPVRFEARLEIANEDDVIAARRRIRQQAADMGFPPTVQAVLAAVLTELARNMIDYAGRGEVHLQDRAHTGRRGLEIVARDHGPGIPNIRETLRSSYSVAGGLGLGLRGIRGLVDTLDIVSVPGKGTTVTARKWRS